MSAHIAILDIGKTNKKILVFNEEYRIVYEYMAVLNETMDEDGFPCEDIVLLTSWITDQIDAVLKNPAIDLMAINFSGYGASFVFINEAGDPVPPLYNYLKPIDQKIKDAFFNTYGEESKIALETSSPVLGLLNSGLQIYRLKVQIEEKYNTIKFALHLPQYCSYIFSRFPCAEITSIGCHTMLWDYRVNNYHQWVRQENIDQIFPAIQPATETETIQYNNKTLQIGYGLHDSSAALIPYLISQDHPFILVSTGTWCIAMNPFNGAPLTEDELHQDCLCYLTYEGKPVKSSRLFLGHEHDEQVHRLATHYERDENFYQDIQPDFSFLQFPELEADLSYTGSQGLWRSGFEKRDWLGFKNIEMAYHFLIHDLVRLQKKSIRLIQNEDVKQLYVDGGFSKNELFMSMLANAIPDLKISSAKVSQASALGAAMVIHQHWNPRPLPEQLVEFKHYQPMS